jgi:hypothetical protein
MAVQNDPDLLFRRMTFARRVFFTIARTSIQGPQISVSSPLPDGYDEPESLRSLDRPIYITGADAQPYTNDMATRAINQDAMILYRFDPLFGSVNGAKSRSKCSAGTRCGTSRLPARSNLGKALRAKFSALSPHYYPQRVSERASGSPPSRSRPTSL